MGLYDRQYMKDGQDGEGIGSVSGLKLGLPRPSRAVKWLLIANVTIFVFQAFFDESRRAGTVGPLSTYLGVTVGGFWQVWRYVTFQFLHAGAQHILMNMLGLYMFGTPLERMWGARRFVKFYLTCGVVAGLAYVLIGWRFHMATGTPIIGASGGVYGILLACAVFFPEFKVFALIPMRVAAVGIFGVMLFVVMQSLSAGKAGKAMSDVAHLGGAIAAATWIWGIPRLRGTFRQGRQRQRQGAWERKMAQRRSEQGRIDAILQKIHDEGINSLTSREKKTLQEASRRQDKEDSEISRL